MVQPSRSSWKSLVLLTGARFNFVKKWCNFCWFNLIVILIVNQNRSVVPRCQKLSLQFKLEKARFVRNEEQKKRALGNFVV